MSNSNSNNYSNNGYLKNQVVDHHETFYRYLSNNEIKNELKKRFSNKSNLRNNSIVEVSVEPPNIQGIYTMRFKVKKNVNPKSNNKFNITKVKRSYNSNNSNSNNSNSNINNGSQMYPQLAQPQNSNSNTINNNSSNLFTRNRNRTKKRRRNNTNTNTKRNRNRNRNRNMTSKKVKR